MEINRNQYAAFFREEKINLLLILAIALIINGIIGIVFIVPFETTGAWAIYGSVYLIVSGIVIVSLITITAARVVVSEKRGGDWLISTSTLILFASFALPVIVSIGRLPYIEINRPPVNIVILMFVSNFSSYIATLYLLIRKVTRNTRVYT